MCIKNLIIILLNISLIFGSEQKLSPIAKSFLLPGWGQIQHQKGTRARFFCLTEALILSGYIFSEKSSRYEKSKYISFAAKHAGVNTNDKGRDFWVDIGNYKNIYNYNQEQLRLRSEDIYSDIEKYYWLWDDEKNRKNFERMRIKSDNYKKTGQFLIGSLVLNHFISAIDALYLTRLKNPILLDFSPLFNRNQTIGLRLEIKFSLS
tara:strand:+ start:310 stop:927 length:618 start_codon:yes stop_codon:yes gene_type:complete